MFQSLIKIFSSGDLYLGNAIWYLVCFALLLIGIKKAAWGPITDMMEKRRQQVLDDLDSAAENRKKAEVLANQREAALSDSRKEASKILSDARANAQATGEQIVKDANDEASAIRKQAKVDADQARTDALKHAHDDVADISVAIAEKLISKNLSSDDHDALVDQFIKGLNK
ncbi:MAG: F0F1 ATP synthase subunit B [Lactobacillus sp.]|nr:F0F1 ATP synthase subunit B [Lactobacillus sp.]